MARILIADDALFMRATIKKVLAVGGHEVIGEAENGRVAIEMADARQPDLILLDITMPELDGIAALTELMRRNAATRVVMCTALGQETKVREALSLGAREYVVKPFTPDKLLAAITRALA